MWRLPWCIQKSLCSQGIHTYIHTCFTVKLHHSTYKVWYTRTKKLLHLCFAFSDPFLRIINTLTKVHVETPCEVAIHLEAWSLKLEPYKHPSWGTMSLLETRCKFCNKNSSVDLVRFPISLSIYISSSLPFHSPPPFHSHKRVLSAQLQEACQVRLQAILADFLALA